MSSETKSRAGAPNATQAMRGRAVTHNEAFKAAQHLINSHFGQKVGATTSVPVRHTDDDVTLMDYILEQRAGEETGTTGAEGLVERLRETYHPENDINEVWAMVEPKVGVERINALSAFYELADRAYQAGKRTATQQAPVTPPAQQFEALREFVLKRCKANPPCWKRGLAPFVDWPLCDNCIRDTVELSKLATPAPVTTPGRDAPELRFLEDVLENFQMGGDGIWAAQKLLVLRIEQLRGEALAAAKEPRG